MTVPVPDRVDQVSDSDEVDLAAIGRQHPILTRMGAAILLVIGIVFTVLSTRLPIGSFVEPDAGTWPLMVSVALVFFSAISLAIPELEEEALDTPHREVWRFLLGLAICGLYGALFWLSGYFLSTAVFVFAVSMVFARPKWWQAALIAVGTGVGIWALFDIVLALPAP